MVDDIDVRIGRNLRLLRLRAGLSLDGLAGCVGRTPATITLYEAGRRRVPVDDLTRLAARLRVTVAAFFA